MRLRKHSIVSRLKMSLSKKGKMPKFIPNNLGRQRTPEQRETYRKASLRAFKNGTRKSWNKGKKGLQNSPRKGKKYLEISGENHWNWKGGITPLKTKIFSSFKYRQWRSDVFTRDNFTCQECGNKKSGNFEAHHIKSFSDIIKGNNIKTIEEAFSCEELWNINNGITLCVRCHNKITYGRK